MGNSLPINDDNDVPMNADGNHGNRTDEAGAEESDDQARDLPTRRERMRRSTRPKWIPATPEDMRRISLPAGAGFSGEECALDHRRINLVFDMEKQLRLTDDFPPEAPTDPLPPPPVRSIFGKEISLRDGAFIPKGSLTCKLKSPNSLNAARPSSEPPPQCVCGKKHRIGDPRPKCDMCGVPLPCIQALFEGHVLDDICPFCTSALNYPIAQACAKPGTSEHGALISVLDFMCTEHASGLLSRDEVWKCYTSYINNNKKAGGRWKAHINATQPRQGRPKKSFRQDSFHKVLEKLNGQDSNLVNIARTLNDNAEEEYMLRMPRCELSISGTGIFDITNSVLSLGPWVVGPYGEFACLFYKVALDTLVYAINASIDEETDEFAVLNINRLEGTKPHLTRDVKEFGGVYALSVGLPSRTCRNALMAVQIIHAAVVHKMRITHDIDTFNARLANEKSAVLSRVVSRLCSLSARLPPLEQLKRKISSTELREQQDHICSIMSRFATAVMDGDVNLSLDEVADALDEASDDFPQLFQIMKALAGEDSNSIVNAATAITRMRINHNRLTDENLWPVLLACAKRNSFAHARIEEVTSHCQKDAFGPDSNDSALDLIWNNQWRDLLRKLEEGEMSVTVYDNMTQKQRGHYRQRVGKLVLTTAAVATYTFMANADEARSSQQPVFSFASDEGQVQKKFGPAAIPFLNPSLFTLDATTDYDKDRTHYDDLIWHWESYIAAKIHVVLHFSKNKPPELLDWICPSADSMAIDFSKEAEKYIGNCQHRTAITSHESYLFDELTSVGTAFTVLGIVKTLQLDVCKIMEEMAVNGNDGDTHILAGDHATIEGVYSNIKYLLSIIAAHIEKHGEDSSLESHPRLCHQIYMLLCHSSFTLWYGIFHYQFAINDLRQKMFGSGINDPIRYYYPHFRNLRGDRHRTDDDSAWRELLDIENGAGWEAVVIEFAKEQKDKIRDVSSMSELVALFREHIQDQIFGDDLTSANSYLNGSQSVPPSSFDYPTALMASFLFINFIFDSVCKAESENCYPMAMTFIRALQPLLVKHNKKNYGWLGAKLVATIETVSDYTRTVLQRNTSLSATGTTPYVGLDRRCEEHVKDMSSFPGDKAKNEQQGLALSRRKLAARTLQKWARTFFGVNDREPFARSIGTGKRASRTAIARRFFTDTGMTTRPCGARNETKSPLVPMANSRNFTVPLSFLETEMRFTNEGKEVVYWGSGDCVYQGNPSEGHVCAICNCPVTPHQRPSEPQAASIREALDDNESVELCMVCETSISHNSQSAQCTNCQAMLCTSCFSLDPNLAKKPPAVLKDYLKSINNGRLEGCYTKKAVIEKIAEIRRLSQISHLAESCPGADLNASGTPPSPGARFLSIGTLNLLRTRTLPQSSLSLIGCIIPVPLSECLPAPANPVLSGENTFEVEVQKQAPGNLGMSLDDNITRTMLPEVATETPEIKVLDVDRGSEAYRLGIRPGDHIQTINGEFLETGALIRVLHIRPLWMIIRRPDPEAAAALLPYERPEAQTVHITYYQPNHAGDPGERISIAELRRLGDAAYLQKMHNATALRLGTQLETAVNVTFMGKDAEGGGYVKQTNAKFMVDTHAANRIRPIEPAQPKTWGSSGLPLMLSFFSVTSKKNQRHSKATRKYIIEKFLPKEKEIESYRQVVYPYILRNAVRIRAYQAEIAQGKEAVSDYTEEAVLSALANAKMEEAARFKQSFVNSCQDEAWRQATPEAASIKWGAFQAAMRAMEEAKNAQSAAIKHLEEKEQRGAEN